MKANLQRRSVLHAGLALGAAAVMRPAGACEYFTSTLRVTHPWTRATEHGANWAVLCMKFDEVRQADRLIGVQTAIATGAEMGGVGARREVDFLIPEGQETYLDESGTFVRLLGLKHALEVGRSYPMRLSFEHGGSFDASLTVDYTRFK